DLQLQFQPSIAVPKLLLPSSLIVLVEVARVEVGGLEAKARASSGGEGESKLCTRSKAGESRAKARRQNGLLIDNPIGPNWPTPAWVTFGWIVYVYNMIDPELDATES